MVSATRSKIHHLFAEKPRVSIKVYANTQGSNHHSGKTVDGRIHGCRVSLDKFTNNNNNNNDGDDTTENKRNSEYNWILLEKWDIDVVKKRYMSHTSLIVVLIRFMFLCFFGSNIISYFLLLLEYILVFDNVCKQSGEFKTRAIMLYRHLSSNHNQNNTTSTTISTVNIIFLKTHLFIPHTRNYGTFRFTRIFFLLV